MVRPTAVITPMTRRSPATPVESAAASEPAAAEARAEEPAKPDIAPVIRSKIQPPALRADTLTRDRLVKRLDEAMASRVVLVIADAGYGKTTLLADYAARSGFRTLWYRLGASDADAITWANYLVAACREVDPSFGSATTSLLANAANGGPPKSAFIESFLGELSRWQEAPTMLVLDDFHEVDNNVEVGEIVERVMTDSPRWLRIVVSARRRPHLPMGRLAAASELSELRTDDLRFSIAEIERLFAESYAQPLEQAVIEQLDRRTRGWAASLQLFHGSIRGRPRGDARQLADSLTGAAGPLYDFLAEEVLANVPDDIADFLVRASILDRVTLGTSLSLFSSEAHPPTAAHVSAWLDDAVSIALLARASESSDSTYLHPLLRDFLRRQLEVRVPQASIEAMHVGIGDHLRDSDPLTAAHHFIEGQRVEMAMQCLGTSILSTIGSGKWGEASDLLDRLNGVPGDPAVAAIRARRLLDDGNPAGAERLLADLDLSQAGAAVRAVVRQTKLTLGWRMANEELVLETLAELKRDPETPPILRDIASVFEDGGSFAGQPAPLPALAARLIDMAQNQLQHGHTFYSAISFHNACVALLNSGDLDSALLAGASALERFETLGFDAPERASTHSIVAECLMERGRFEEAEIHAAAALNDRDFADVPAELAVVYTSLGARTRARELLARAESLHVRGRSDVGGIAVIEVAAAMAVLPGDPRSAIDRLSTPTFDWALDLGQSFRRICVQGQAYLLLGDKAGCLDITVPASAEAKRRGAKRELVRLSVLVAIARDDASAFRAAIAESATQGHLALHELADVICAADGMLTSDNDVLRAAIADVPHRWLPALRRQLGKGAPAGNSAATLLDLFGDFDDVGRLRAYAKTYRRRGAPQNLGLALARRTSPRLHVRDLGRVILAVGEREIPLSSIRRKPAALLMYLLTRPSFSANREQVLDELWPDADPDSASNSLNQTLYFLRREIDPWYEDGVSVEYVNFGGELVWLDPSLVTSDSSRFLQRAAQVRARKISGNAASDLLRSYAGHFATDFEYEEWAMNWRSRLHSTMLEIAHSSLESCIRAGQFAEARDIAIAVLDVDPTATDIERRLVWLQWHIGARSASRAQFAHLERLEAEEGGPPITLGELVDEWPNQ